MKTVMEPSAKITIRVMLVFALIGLVLFFIDFTNPDFEWSVDGLQMAIWEVLVLGIALGIKLYKGSYITYDENGNVISKSR